MRRRASGRVDGNQAIIVKALRNAGWHVCITSSLKHGVPDLVVSKGGWMAYVEVKASPKDKLTPDEADFMAVCRGPYIVATGPGHAISACEHQRWLAKQGVFLCDDEEGLANSPGLVR